MERDRQAASDAKKPAAPSFDPDKISRALAETDARLDNLRGGLKSTDEHIAGLEAKIQSLPPREKPAAEDQLSTLKKSRASMREVIVQAEEQQLAARENHQAAKRDAAHRADDVLSRIATAASAFDASLRAASESLRTIQDEAKGIEVLGVSIRSHMKPDAVLKALHFAGLGEALGMPPDRNAQPLEKGLEPFASTARMRKAETKKEQR